jgi:hypothetical protein
LPTAIPTPEYGQRDGYQGLAVADGVVDVGGDDDGALAGEHVGHGCADSAGRSGDQYHLVL